MNITVVQKSLIFFRHEYCRYHTKTVMGAEMVVDFTLFLRRSIEIRCMNPVFEKSVISEGKLNKDFTI